MDFTHDEKSAYRKMLSVKRKTAKLFGIHINPVIWRTRYADGHDSIDVDIYYGGKRPIQRLFTARVINESSIGALCKTVVSQYLEFATYFET